MNRLQEEWLKTEKAKLSPGKGIRGKRQYLHFDKRILNLTEEVSENVWSSDEVMKHSFYPFIRFVKSTNRYKRIPGTKKKKIIKKQRAIDYAAHFDALIFSWYAALLSVPYEKSLDKTGLKENVIAYRQLDGKSNVEFATDVFNFIKEHPSYVAIAYDVSDFFGTIDHKLLKKLWSELLENKGLPNDHYKVFRAITKYRYVELVEIWKLLGFGPKEHGKKGQVCTSKELEEKIIKKGLLRPPKSPGKGIPQGSAISCLLSNMYMLPFDQAVAKAVEEVGGIYRRYSDDIMIVVPEKSVATCGDIVFEAIKERRLTLNISKTEIRKFTATESRLTAVDWENNLKQKLQYLGMEYDGEEIFLRHGGIARYQAKMTHSVKSIVRWAYKNKRPIPKGILKSRYTRQSKRNYLTYADRAQKSTGSHAIKKQVSNQRVEKNLKKKMKKQGNLT